MATADKLDYLLETKNQIKQAIKGKGVGVEDTDSFRSYASKIGQIEGNREITNGWQPEADWWDIETILENDTENHPAKVICLLTDELDDKSVSNTVKGANKYKLSDGQIIEATSLSQSINIDNLFDITKDKECSKGYKTRYIIYLIDNEKNTNSLEFPNNAIFLIFSNTKLTKLNVKSRKYLQSIRFLNSASAVINDTYQLFYNCMSLQEYPNINLGETNFIETFYNCNSLREVHGIHKNEMMAVASAFNGCYSLERVPYIDTSKCYSINTLFNNCYSLRQIEKLDMKNINSASSVFNGCNLLTEIKEIYNIPVSLNLTSCNYLKCSTLLKILNALVDLSGQASKTLSLGSTNLAKLSDEEKAIATNKNWTLS